VNGLTNTLAYYRLAKMTAVNSFIVHAHGVGIFFHRGKYYRCHYTQHNDTQHNDTQHNDTQHYDTQHKDIKSFCAQHKGLIRDSQHNKTLLSAILLVVMFHLSLF